MPDAIDLCVCGHARDEHPVAAAGACDAVVAEYDGGVRRYCPCGHYEPEEDEL